MGNTGPEAKQLRLLLIECQDEEVSVEKGRDDQGDCHHHHQNPDVAASHPQHITKEDRSEAA